MIARARDGWRHHRIRLRLRNDAGQRIERCLLALLRASAAQLLYLHRCTATELELGVRVDGPAGALPMPLVSALDGHPGVRSLRWQVVPSAASHPSPLSPSVQGAGT